MKKTRLPEEALKFFRRAGAAGGRKRAAVHPPEDLSQYGATGGRPPLHVRKRGAQFWLDVTVEGRRYREPLGAVKLAEAKARAAARIAELETAKGAK